MMMLISIKPKKYRVAKQVHLALNGLPEVRWCLEVKSFFIGWSHLYGFKNEEDAFNAKEMWEKI